MTRSRDLLGKYTAIPPYRIQKDPFERLTATYLFRLKRANLLHLLDLKRAGHSPTRTELHLMKKSR
jgi:hypothetical protein